jgi:hypothetical protein
LETVGAIFIRAIATLVVAYILKVPGLHFIGGYYCCGLPINLLVMRTVIVRSNQIIIVFSSCVLVCTASEMIGEENLKRYIHNKIVHYSFEVLVVAVVITMDIKR